MRAAIMRLAARVHRANPDCARMDGLCIVLWPLQDPCDECGRGAWWDSTRYGLALMLDRC